MIHLVEVDTESGAWELEVNDNQKNFVASRDVILARAYMRRKYRSQAYWIYNDDFAVGIVLYTDSMEDDSFDLSEILIDKNYQHRGYGTEAVKLVLEKMRQDGKYNKVTTCYVEGNEESRKLFTKLGFTVTEQNYDEIGMEYIL